MDECLLLVPDVNESRIQCRHYLLHLSEEDIAHSEAVLRKGFPVELDQLVVVHQSELNFGFPDIDNQIFN